MGEIMARRTRKPPARGEQETSNADLLARVAETHAHFSELMQRRFHDADRAVVERYLAILAGLVAKLEDEDKSLRQVARETIAESAAQILAELA